MSDKTAVFLPRDNHLVQKVAFFYGTRYFKHVFAKTRLIQLSRFAPSSGENMAGVNTVKNRAELCYSGLMNLRTPRESSFKLVNKIRLSHYHQG
jgi:hypothetical protein